MVGSLIKSLKQNFIPYFDEIVPYMLPLLVTFSNNFVFTDISPFALFL